MAQVLTKNLFFKKQVEIELDGIASESSICLCDVDNDKLDELVIGTNEGTIYIYKFYNPTKFSSDTNFGMITCILCGPICRPNYNTLIVISGKGLIHLIDVIKTQNSKEAFLLTLKPWFSQHIPANCKTGILVDLDGDGLDEIILGLTDRIVRSFKWMPEVGYNGKDGGKLVAYHKWELIKQIGNLSFDHGSLWPTPQSGDGAAPRLLCSQPGNSYVVLGSKIDQKPVKSEVSTGVGVRRQTMPLAHTQRKIVKNGVTSLPFLDVKYVMVNPMEPVRNANVSTEICSGLSKHSSSQGDTNECWMNYTALITMDGTLTLTCNDKTLLCTQLENHQLFGLCRFDLIGTADGSEQFVFSSWSGITYVIQPKSQDTILMLKHTFPEDIRAFAGGHYAYDEEVGNVPCLVYVTFDNLAYILMEPSSPAS